MTNLRRTLYLVLGAAGLALGGCEFYGDKERTWTEDVLLEDGTKLKIKRHVEFTDHNSLARDAYGAFDTKATLEFLGSPMPVPPVWDAPLIALLLYRDAATNEWVLVTTVGMCETWAERGSPMPPYWEFRSDGGAWRSTHLSVSSIGRDSNLFSRYRAGVPSRHLTVDEKAKIRSKSLSTPKYRRILNASEARDYCGGVSSHKVKPENQKN